jgi:hypothetical protein
LYLSEFEGRALGAVNDRRPNTDSAIVCDVGALQAANAEVVDALARMHLQALRVGCRLELRNASDQLRELIVFMGLCEVLRLETRRQPEDGEQALGLQEEVQPDDLPV